MKKLPTQATQAVAFCRTEYHWHQGKTPPTGTFRLGSNPRWMLGKERQGANLCRVTDQDCALDLCLLTKTYTGL